jgi:MFS transporter, ACS family, solute carrier family 17 (sodium-dependent inorganic phosphate cotransporter), member 5
MVGSSFLGDFLVEKEYLSRLSARKIFTGLCMFIPMITLILISFVNCSQPYLAVSLLTIGMSFLSFGGTVGFHVNTYEIAGPFTGIIIGLTNLWGTLPGVIGPYFVSIITTNVKKIIRVKIKNFGLL